MIGYQVVSFANIIANLTRKNSILGSLLSQQRHLYAFQNPSFLFKSVRFINSKKYCQLSCSDRVKNFVKMIFNKNTSVFFPGEFHGQRSMVDTMQGVEKSQTGLND